MTDATDTTATEVVTAAQAEAMRKAYDENPPDHLRNALDELRKGIDSLLDQVWGAGYEGEGRPRGAIRDDIDAAYFYARDLAEEILGAVADAVEVTEPEEVALRDAMNHTTWSHTIDLTGTPVRIATGDKRERRLRVNVVSGDWRVAMEVRERPSMLSPYWHVERPRDTRQSPILRYAIAAALTYADVPEHWIDAAVRDILASARAMVDEAFGA